MATRKAGDARTEEQRRARVVKGWVYNTSTDAEIAEIRAYLKGGPVPKGYEVLDAKVR